MADYSLSILIPARNEVFLTQTVEDIIKNKRGKTEVIVGLDGQWANPGIPDHPDVRILYISESIGQRAMTNQLAKLSKAKYVMKMDSHCSFDEGFDQKMLEVINGHDTWTMAPAMKNLHAFNWECPVCGSQWYQGPSPNRCMKNIGNPGQGTTENEVCNNTSGFFKTMVWIPRQTAPTNTSYRFDKTLHFQYFREFAARPEGQGDITPSLSLQGSCFMMTRERYFDLNICDEEAGSWGHQGTEVACKSWLSGGAVMINHNTWYAHLFRTQGGDFGFPYLNKGAEVDKARRHIRSLFIDGKWDKAIYPLNWLIDKFAPVPDWGNKPPTKGILFFTDNELSLKLSRNVQSRIKKIAQDKAMQLVSSSRKPMHDMGKNVVTPEPRGYLTMFKQILKGLEALNTDIVFMAEHDVLYPPEHFDFTPLSKTKFYYDQNWWKVHTDGFTIHWDADQVSGLCAYRQPLIEHYKQRIATFDQDNFDRKFEPMSGENSEAWKASVPYIDVRTGKNLTYNKRSIDDFRQKASAVNLQTIDIDKVPGWDNLSQIFS